MEISVNQNRAIILGNIKSVSDFQEIKTKIDLMVTSQKDIVVDIKESLSITSSVIGYFNKLILKDKIRVTMNIGNKQLFELLDDLSLRSVFNAKKV